MSGGAPSRRSQIGNRQSAMTLVEVVVGLTVLLIAATIAFQAFGFALREGRAQARRLQAVTLLEGVADEVRNTPLSKLPPERFRLAGLESGNPSGLRAPNDSVRIELARSPVVSGSVEVRDDEGVLPGSRLEVDARHGTVTIERPSGDEVSVAYRYVADKSPGGDVAVTVTGKEVTGQEAKTGSPAKCMTITALWDEGKRERRRSLMLVRWR